MSDLFSTEMWCLTLQFCDCMLHCSPISNIELQMSDMFSTEMRRLHEEAKLHYDQVSSRLQSSQTAVKQVCTEKKRSRLLFIAISFP